MLRLNNLESENNFVNLKLITLPKPKKEMEDFTYNLIIEYKIYPLISLDILNNLIKNFDNYEISLEESIRRIKIICIRHLSDSTFETINCLYENCILS